MNLDFNAMLQTWQKVLTNPGEAVFQEERKNPDANLQTALIWMVIAGVVSAVFAAIANVVSGLIGTAGLLGQFGGEELGGALAAQGGLTVVGVISAACISLIAVPVGFLIGAGIYYVIAKFIFGGTGEFEEQAYLMATYTAPITMVNGALNIIPILGPCLGLIVAIYNIVLTYYALKVTHNMSQGQAIGTIAIPIAVIFLCVCAVGLVAGIGIGAAAGGTNGF